MLEIHKMKPKTFIQFVILNFIFISHLTEHNLVYAEKNDSVLNIDELLSEISKHTQKGTKDLKFEAVLKHEVMDVAIIHAEKQTVIDTIPSKRPKGFLFKKTKAKEINFDENFVRFVQAGIDSVQKATGVSPFFYEENRPYLFLKICSAESDETIWFKLNTFNIGYSSAKRQSYWYKIFFNNETAHFIDSTFTWWINSIDLNNE
jgi:hypothetical protein